MVPGSGRKRDFPIQIKISLLKIFDEFYAKGYFRNTRIDLRISRTRSIDVHEAKMPLGELGNQL